VPIERSAGGGGGGTSALTLQYDYTAPAAQASIDTTVDGPLAGLFPTTGRALLILFAFRVDSATFVDTVSVTVNNDASAVYNRAFVGTSAAGPTQVASAGANAWLIGGPGASAVAGSFAEGRFEMLGYAATTTGRWKTFVELVGNANNTTAGQYQVGLQVLQYQTTNTAIRRMTVTPTTGGVKLLAGSQLTAWIYS
jgi:hypothetical protein